MVCRRTRHIWRSSVSNWAWYISFSRTIGYLLMLEQALKRIEVIADDESEIIEVHTTFS